MLMLVVIAYLGVAGLASVLFVAVRMWVAYRAQVQARSIASSIAASDDTYWRHQASRAIWGLTHPAKKP